MTDKILISRRRLLTTGLSGGGALFLAPVLVSPLFLMVDDAQAEENITELVNKVRRQNGVAPLSPDNRLQKAALYQAQLMAKNGKIGHSIGWGNSFTGRLKQAGIRGPAAENVASGQKDVSAALTAWLNSAGHRRNLLDPIFTHYGLASAATAEKPNYRYWAMLYGIGNIE